MKYLFAVLLCCFIGINISQYANTQTSFNVKTDFPTIELTPNPVTDYLYLNIKTPFDEEEVSYRLCNLLGKTVSEGSFTGNKLQIDLSEQQPGVYFIQLEYEGHKECRQIRKR